MKKKFTRITLLGSFLLLMYQCATVPITGRHQLILFPEDQMVQTSLTSYSSFIKENKLSSDDSAKNRIRKVGARISKAVEQYLREHGLESEIQNFQWEFNLVVSNEPNAWCMPGGKVVFYEGYFALLPERCGHRCRHGARNRSRRGPPQQRTHEPTGTGSIRSVLPPAKLLGHNPRGQQEKPSLAQPQSAMGSQRGHHSRPSPVNTNRKPIIWD